MAHLQLPLKSVNVWATRLTPDGRIPLPEIQEQRSSRATRVIDDPRQLLFVHVPRAPVDKEAVDRAVRVLVTKGLKWDDNSYRFLGYTQDHLTEGTFVLFREDDTWTAARFCEQLGCPDALYQEGGYEKVARCLALAFSFSADAFDVPNGKVVWLDDVVRASKRSSMNECGMIADSTAKRVCEALDLPPSTSVFHVQRGGLDATLARYPDDVFARLCNAGASLRAANLGGNDHWIALRRPAAELPQGSRTMLEVRGYSSRPSPARLSAEEIKKMLALGVSPKVFQDLLDDEIDAISRIPADRDQALRFVKDELVIRPTNFHNELYSMLVVMHDLKEPYVKWSTEVLRHQQLESVAADLRIHVEESCRVYGVVDEEGILEEGEVFVNLPSRGTPAGRPVLIMRESSPSIEDTCVLKAVRCPTLKHLTNCIVFPKKFEHAIFNSAPGTTGECRFFVTWNSDLIPAPQVKIQINGFSANTTPHASYLHIRRLNMKTVAADLFVRHMFDRFPTKSTIEPSQVLAFQLDEGHLDALRRQVIKREPVPTIEEYTFDETLDIRYQDEVEWDRAYADAASVYRAFSKDLGECMGRDGSVADGYGDTLLAYGVSASSKHADALIASYRARYFEGETTFVKHVQTIRASAWYHYGYMQKNALFAWIGMSYLNRLRADCSPLHGSPSSTKRASRTSSRSGVSSASTAIGTSPSLKEATSRAVWDEIDELLSAILNDKPRQPVASNPPPCPEGPDHKWRHRWANQYGRGYKCAACGLEVDERKDNGRWAGYGASSRPAAEYVRDAPLPRTTGAGGSANLGNAQMHCKAESTLKKEESPSDNKTLVLSSSTPGASMSSSRAAEDSPLFYREQNEIAAATMARVRPVSSTPSKKATPQASIQLREKSDLIDHNPPRPPAPVAAHPEIGCCKDDADDHAWHCYWGNGSARYYRCLSCSIVVKECKRAPRWVGY